jgi:hypothetical protein
MTDVLVFLADNGIDSSQLREVIFDGFRMSWPVWVVVGSLFAGYLLVGILRRVSRARSRSRWR